VHDYAGVDMSDDKTRLALMEFSFNLTIGNLDDSCVLRPLRRQRLCAFHITWCSRYKAIKMASTTAAWRSMATICIRHKRLDVAEVCLGFMGNILGVRAIREAADLPEADARLAAEECDIPAQLSSSFSGGLSISATGIARAAVTTSS
jgi:intraflagellar transport protein 140